MKRYLISLIFCFGCIIFGIFHECGFRLIYLNIFSFITIGILPIIYMGILFGLKEISLAFFETFKKEHEKNQLEKGLNFFNLYGKTIWVTCITAIILVFIAMMVVYEDKTQLGAYLGYMSNNIFYCGIITLTIIIPYTVFIKRKLLE